MVRTLSAFSAPIMAALRDQRSHLTPIVACYASGMSEPLDPLDELYSNPAPLVDFIKLQIGFWEKIVVLDSAILGLTFTAAGFSAHTQPVMAGSAI